MPILGAVPDNPNVPLNNHSNEVILVVSDYQFPFAHQHAVKVIEKVAQQLKPHVLMFLGDICDFPSLSKKFRTSPNLRGKVVEEVQEAKEHVHRLVELAEPEEVWWIDGNHEDRLRRHIEDNAPELASILNVSNFGIESMIGLPDLDVDNYIYYPYPQGFIHRGSLYFHHGIYHGKNSRGIRREVLERGVSVIQGHTHCLNSITERRMDTRHPENDKYIAGYENGCLCNFQAPSPPYGMGVPRATRFPNWQLGFSVVQFFDDMFHVEQCHIINGRTILRGEEIRV